ncbi:MAG: aldo/keto reductase [Christensenellaceae bacterium]|jgi:aryl-alcohol dehydrogenase-like predicted oxidoreductase
MKLCLGTVQFGMDYGIAKNGRPSRAEVMVLLEYAIEQGIRCFDTAAAYGEAEEVIGAFFKDQPRDAFEIITKIRPDALDGVPVAEYTETIQTELARSVEKLGIGYVDGCLFHNAESVYDEHALGSLARLKETGLAQKTGVSIYMPGQFFIANESPHVDIVQLPYNLIDNRLDGFLPAAEKEIHARSVFLQGLLLMEPANTPAHLPEARGVIEKIDACCKKHKVSRSVLLMSYVKQNKHIDKIVFGVDTLSQLKEILSDYNADIDMEIIATLKEELPAASERLLVPSMWNTEEMA